MAEKSIEERLQLLEESNQKQTQLAATLQETCQQQQKEIQRLEAVHQIQNLMSREQFYHAAGMHKEVMTLFAKKTPGVSVEISSSGKWEGAEGMKRVNDMHIQGWGDCVGEMAVHTLTTPIIEVAGDCQTAKAVWVSPGARTTQNKETQTFEPSWAWLRYGVDFVKEDGEWKIWHSHAYGIFRAPFYTSWVDVEKEKSPQRAPFPDELKPNGTGSPDSPYSTTTAPKLLPVPPEPYETFDQTFSY